MTETIKRMVFTVLGLLFVGFGLVGLFLPVLQGVLFLIIGASMLSYRTRWGRRLEGRLEAEFPTLMAYLKRRSRRVRAVATMWRRRLGRKLVMKGRHG